MHVVLYASNLNVSLNFWTCKNIMQWWARIHPASVSMFISCFKTSVNAASLYGADSLLALDLHLLSVYLCKWYKCVHAHINEAPTDVWDRYEYVLGIGPGSCCAPEIQALPSFRRAEISAHGNIPGLLWEEVLALWSMQMWCCLPLQRCMLFLQTQAYTWELRKLCLKCYHVLISCLGRLWHFSLDVWVLGENSPVEEGQILGHSFGFLSIVYILDPTLGTVPGQEACTGWAAVLRLINISIKQGTKIKLRSSEGCAFKNIHMCTCRYM